MARCAGAGTGHQPPPAVCPLTECMALIGGAWAPNVIWYLGSGSRRFGELRGDIPADLGAGA